jgi:poly(A) polymerase
MAFMNVQKMRTSKLRRFMAGPDFADEVELHRVDCLGSHGMTDNLDFIAAKQREFSSEPLLPPRLLSGHELIALGVPAGPALGRMLGEIETLQLEGRLRTHDEALGWAAENAGRFLPRES